MYNGLLRTWAFLGVPVVFGVLGRTAVEHRSDDPNSLFFLAFLPAVAVCIGSGAWSFFASIGPRSIWPKTAVALIYVLGMGFLFLMLLQMQMWGAMDL
jgi:hypothetical protein